ncbi:unnamed protein product [Protopolystoma xenopodis]|uniref:Tyrosine-protein phosphatase domain-containing protein n=1 Tax=Protopolystoma xenopodis TaxID=117903 RepID=A0A3S5CPF3_9PLAT|nr:unnamed protein product [Protopolystoma xenopodis]
MTHFKSYINANYIPEVQACLSLKDVSKAESFNTGWLYIATQGPTKQTSGDFWRMVVEQHSPIIVMLTG